MILTYKYRLREWWCSACGEIHDRDVNAARNILALGLSAQPLVEESRVAAEQLGEQPREEYTAYTCVFPQPGCQVDALRPEWRERAQKILLQYNTALAAEGMRVQGCCCGHAHQKLDDTTVAQLRNCGFLVEHNSEPT